MHSPNKLIEEIIKLSNSENWDIAKTEWKLFEIYEASEPEQCLCGHTPIIEVCILKNEFNQNTAIVGNVCVKKFIGLPSDRMFKAIKEVQRNNAKSLNYEAICLAEERGWLTEKEFSFLTDTIRKRKMTEKQLDWRKKLNAKILLNMKYSRR